MDNEEKPVRWMTIGRAFLDYFAATVGVTTLVVGGAGFIWDISSVISYSVSIGAGVIVGLSGGVEKYRSTRKKIIKEKEDNEKINMVVAELEAAHVLAHSRSTDFTSQLSTLVARTGSDRTVRRRRPHSHVQPQGTTPTQGSPGTASRATTFNINVDPAMGGMQLDLRRNEEGGISVLTYPKRATDSPSTPGLHPRATPPPLEMTQREPQEKPDQPSPPSTPRL
jgi:hypothetical protein